MQRIDTPAPTAYELRSLRPWAPKEPDPGSEAATAWFVVHDVDEPGHRVHGEALTGPFKTLEHARESLNLIREETPAARVARHVIHVFERIRRGDA